jgi:hypothetical protein
MYPPPILHSREDFMLFARLRAGAVCLLLGVFAIASDARAQATATLTGHVIDPQGAAVPHATVVVQATATSASWTLTSDTDGRFTVPLLPPGVFNVRVTAAGFRPWQGEGLRLEVGQDVQIDVPLAIGTLQESVTISETATMSRTTAVDGVLSASRIESLPLNGRNFLELALLVPGNQPTPVFDPTKSNSVLISSAGSMGRGGNITIDGQDNNDDVVGGPLMNLPIDAVQEFQIATNRFSAELGRSASSVVNVITRSGSNELHGSAALFTRDSAWQAFPATLDRSAGEPPFDRQQIAGSLGGPLRRDRVFGFGAVEYRHQNGGVMVGTRDLATRSIRRSFAEAPLRDGLWSFRLDAGPASSLVSLRYAGEDAKDTGASTLDRAIGSASQRQTSRNKYHSLLGTWNAIPSNTIFNALSVSLSTFDNRIEPVAIGPQLTFPSIQDGSSFRVPQGTTQRRLQVADTLSMVRGRHTFRAGGELQRVDAEFDLEVFQQGRIEMVQDFPAFDANGDGRVDDNDLLFAVTLRSGKPDRPLIIPDADNTHAAMFAQDDWHVSDRLQVSVGLRYELDTDVNNQSRVAELNPLILPFLSGTRQRDRNNFGPRLGLVWSSPDGRTIVRGGYGTYYDRIVLELQSLERGLDGRALPIEVRAGNVFFADPNTGQLAPGAPTLANPFTGFVLPGAGASGINILDNHLQNPMVHQFNLGVEREIAGVRVRIDGLHDRGTHFIIGRTVGNVFNPVVGGPDRVVNLESSARANYDALLATAERRFAGGSSLRVSYTLAKALNYANDDQIPFSNGPIDPTNLRREYGPAANDRRHRLVLSGQTELPGHVRIAGIWTLSSGVPMDILLPDGSTRIPVLQRNAGGRVFTTASELNTFISSLNASGGISGVPLPLVSGSARFTDSFNSIDLRVSRRFALGSHASIEPIAEIFNVFNVTNILGASITNYSGFSNVLVRDSDTPGTAGYLTSSRFGQPVTTAGGVFGSGGPRALQLAARLTF